MSFFLMTCYKLDFGTKRKINLSSFQKAQAKLAEDFVRKVTVYTVKKARGRKAKVNVLKKTCLTRQQTLSDS